MRSCCVCLTVCLCFEAHRKNGLKNPVLKPSARYRGRKSFEAHHLEKRASIPNIYSKHASTPIFGHFVRMEVV